MNGSLMEARSVGVEGEKEEVRGWGMRGECMERRVKEETLG